MADHIMIGRPESETDTTAVEAEKIEGIGQRTSVWIVADKHGMPICVCASESVAQRFERETERFLYVYEISVEDENSITERILEEQAR